MKRSERDAAKLPFDLDLQVFNQIDQWRQRLISEADLGAEAPDLLTLLDRLSRVRVAIEQVVGALREPSAQAAATIKDATDVLMDLCSNLTAEGDIFGNLHTLRWAIEHKGQADAFLADLECVEAQLRADHGKPVS
jgi:hypothetical protein